MSRDNTSYISVRAYNTSIGDLGLCPDERYRNNTGIIQQSRIGRITEIDAELLSRWGLPIPASDTIGELRAKGCKRCPRCGHYKPPEAYGTYRRKEYERLYQKTYCHACLADMEKTRRFSKVEPKSPYPARIA